MRESVNIDTLPRKLFAGSRIRRFRRDLGLNQMEMAQGLGISASYLNLVERDQRPLSAQLIVRLAEKYNLDLKSLVGDDSDRIAAQLNEIFADPLLERFDVTERDFAELARNAPFAVSTVITLYGAYRQLSERNANLAERVTGVPETGENDHLLVGEIRDFASSQKNYFGELEAEADILREKCVRTFDGFSFGLRKHLRVQHGISVEYMPAEFMKTDVRRFDPKNKKLYISEFLTRSEQRHEIARQIAFLEHSDLMNQIIHRAGYRRAETVRAIRPQLASYFSVAVHMPYEPFLQAAKQCRYDVQLLAPKFKATYKRVCHRLTTLQRPGAEGIKFFFIRFDRAGNVLQRRGAASFQFARYGGGCPRWNVHDAFSHSGRILTQIIQLPDKSTFFSISKAIEGPQIGFQYADLEFAVCLGCDIADAGNLVYSDGYDLSDPRLITPVGLSCRLCERLDCNVRAAPPINRSTNLDENITTLSPFQFQNKD